MKVLISGCARSGTTILTHMMRYFYSTKVQFEDEMHPLEMINYNHSDHVMVIKKPYLEKSNVEHFSLSELLSGGWKVIWLLRDGRDVITSKNHSVSQSRWIKSNIEYLNHHQNEQVLLIRYENLVRHPQKEMDRIKGFIHKEYQDDFLNFHTLMDDSPMNSGIEPKPLSPDAIGRYKDLPAIKLNKDFTHLLNLFGYEL